MAASSAVALTALILDEVFSTLVHPTTTAAAASASVVKPLSNSDFSFAPFFFSPARFQHIELSLVLCSEDY